MEGFGNEPIGSANYGDWPNIMAVINDTHRVYHTWVNGSEHFYFKGDTEALNAALKNFAAIKADRRTVVLRPGKCSRRKPPAWSISNCSRRFTLLLSVSVHRVGCRVQLMGLVLRSSGESTGMVTAGATGVRYRNWFTVLADDLTSGLTKPGNGSARA